jgi:hypothetical protein
MKSPSCSRRRHHLRQRNTGPRAALLGWLEGQPTSAGPRGAPARCCRGQALEFMFGAASGWPALQLFAAFCFAVLSSSMHGS